MALWFRPSVASTPRRVSISSCSSTPVVLQMATVVNERDAVSRADKAPEVHWAPSLPTTALSLPTTALSVHTGD